MIMRRALAVACLLAVCVSLAGARTETQRVKKGPVRVFLLIGQSNMNGRGNVKVLDEKLTKDLYDKVQETLDDEQLEKLEKYNEDQKEDIKKALFTV